MIKLTIFLLCWSSAWVLFSLYHALFNGYRIHWLFVALHFALLAANTLLYRRQRQFML